MAEYNPNSHLAYLRQGVGKEMARCSHTLTCCLSMPRVCLEAGKKQLRVRLEYVWSMAEVFLRSSFGAPLVLLWSPSMYEVAEAMTFGGLKMGRRRREEGAKIHVLTNVCEMAHEAGLVTSRTYVQSPMKLCSYFERII